MDKLLIILLLLIPASAGAQDPFANKAPTGGILHRPDTVVIRMLIPTDGSYGKVFGGGTELVESIMTEAFRHLGKRYRSGGKGPTVFDCSGFTGYVFRKHSYEIGASSRDQYARNTPIRRDEIQCGDLVFFTSPGSGRNVGHVGIVVDVDPVTLDFTFIHASSKNGVKLSSSTESNYAKRYVGARRILELSAL